MIPKLAPETMEGPEINETDEQVSANMNADTCENNKADNGSDNAETCEGITLEELSADFKNDSAKEITEGDLKEETTHCKLKCESELNVDNQASVSENVMKLTKQSPDSKDSTEVSLLNTKNLKRSSNESEESTSIDAKSVASSSAGKSSTTTLGPLDSAEEGPPAYSSSSTGKSFTRTLGSLCYTKEGASAYASTDSELGCQVEATGDGHQESMFVIFYLFISSNVTVE